MFCFRAHSKRPANITSNLIGVADNNNVHSTGSQKQRERNASLSWAAVSGEERCVTSDDPNNGCEGDYTTKEYKENGNNKMESELGSSK